MKNTESLSPREARQLADELRRKAAEADRKINESLVGTAMTNGEIARLIQADYHLLAYSGIFGEDRLLEAITVALDAYKVGVERQKNIDAMRRAINALSTMQTGRSVEEIIDAVLHEPYLVAIAGLRAQIKKLEAKSARR